MRARRAQSRPSARQRLPARVANAPRRPRRPLGGPDWPRQAPRACRSATRRAPPARARRARCAAGRMCRREFPSLEFQGLAGDLDLVAALPARVTQGLLELLLARWPTDDTEPPIGAEDAECPARVRLRPVDQEVGEAIAVVLGRSRRRTQLEQR